ncbi:MAG: hypothetical protein ACLRSA_01105 [Streptococcus salivarius]
MATYHSQCLFQAHIGGFSSSGASELVSDVEPVSEVAVEEDSEVTVELELPVEAASEVESTVDAASNLADDVDYVDDALSCDEVESAVEAYF